MREQRANEMGTGSTEILKRRILKLDARDNVVVALEDLRAGEEIAVDGARVRTVDAVPAKHKFALEPLAAGAAVTMYGVLVGRARVEIAAGGLFTTANLAHESATRPLTCPRYCRVRAYPSSSSKASRSASTFRFSQKTSGITSQ